MKQKTTNKRKNILSVLVVISMLVATLLTACSSGETAAAPANEETPAVEAGKEAEPTTEEVAEEPEIEPVVYDGIDMESTLPGTEWIKTFNGVITDPKMVIFNDDTNKKIIVENGQEVEFSDTDILAIFIPLEKNIVRSELEDNLTFKSNSAEKNVRFYDNVSARINNGDKVEIKQKLEVDGEEVVLTATLVIRKSE